MAKKNFDFMERLLKDYIDNNGLPSLTANALHVYEMLKKNGDPYEAGAVYLTLLAGIPMDAEKLDIDSLK